MMFLEVDLAIYQRLTGAPLDSEGRPLLNPTTRIPVNTSRIMPPSMDGGFGPSYGIRIPTMKNPNDYIHNLTSKDPQALPLFSGMSGGLKQIPVFSESVDGRKYLDIFPCVSFGHTSTEFDNTVFYYADEIRETNPSANDIDILNRLNDTIDSGASSYYTRPHPEGYKVGYDITARARTKMEVEFMSECILRLFPAMGALKVTYMDGTYNVCDMLLQETQNQDDITGLGSEEPKNYIRTFSYIVEAYVDNSIGSIPGYNQENVQLKNTLIYNRILELETLQERLYQRQDLNTLELEAI